MCSDTCTILYKISFSGYYVDMVMFQKQIGCQRKLSIPKYIDLSPEGKTMSFM